MMQQIFGKFLQFPGQSQGLPYTQLVDYWGRRPVYIFSGIMSVISLGTQTLIFFFLKDFLKTDISSVT